MTPDPPSSTPAAAADPADSADSADPVTLFAFVRRRDGSTREQFLDHWRNHHGPLIRDTPGLGDRVLRYEQHAALPVDRSGWDGVAVQQFASWDHFVGMLSDPAAAAMRADESEFLDPASVKVVFTHDRVVMIDRDPTRPEPGSDDG